MAVALADIIATPTKEEILARLLLQLRGLGWTQHTGSGTGDVVAAAGTPQNDFDVVLTVTTAGQLGTAQFSYSSDGGLTTIGTAIVPASGVWDFAGTGVTFQWKNGTESAELSFLVGDVFRCALRKNGFPVTSWQPLSVPRTLLENDAALAEDFFKLASNIAAGGFILIAAELNLHQWVDLHAQQVYDEQRNPGSTTKGVIVLTDAQNQGPFTKAAGELIVATPFGLRFLNDAGFTLPLGGTVSVPVTAESVGSDYNVGNNTIVALVTTLPGVTVNNPDPGTGTWLTADGKDRETSLALARRCIDKWKQLGTGTPTGVYDAWAKQASTNVAKTVSYVDTVIPGRVLLYVSGANGPLPGGEVADIGAYVQQQAPLTVLVLTQSPAVQNVLLTGTVYVASNYLVSAMAEVSANLIALIENLPIGGTLWWTQVIDAIQSAKGVRNVVLTAPTTNVVLPAATIATLTNSLVFTAV